jgi:hypothetical protein
MPELVRVGGARPPPFITFTITSKVAVYAPAEWADTLTLFHLLLRYVLCDHLYYGFYSPLPLKKSGLKLVCNVNIVYGNLMTENSQDNAQKPP